MSNSLCIEIRKNGEVVANACYQNAAHSCVAARKTQKVVLTLASERYGSTDERAVRALLASGAKFSTKERNRLGDKAGQLRAVSLMKVLGRNDDDVIGLSEWGIATNEDDSDSIVTVDMDNWTVNFGVLMDVSADAAKMGDSVLAAAKRNYGANTVIAFCPSMKPTKVTFAMFRLFAFGLTKYNCFQTEPSGTVYGIIE